MKMNNIYLPDGFPNTPDVKDMGGQYTAGDGIAIGSDGSISVDYGPGVTMTSTDKLTLDYGPGLDMTTTDKLTIKAGNGLQLSGADLAAKIGKGMKFSDGEISLDYTESTIDLFDTLSDGRVKRGEIIVREYSDHVDLYVHAYNLNVQSGITVYLYCNYSDYTNLPVPARYVEEGTYDTAICIGFGATYKNWSTYAASCLFGCDGSSEYGVINVKQSTSVDPTEVSLYMTYKKEVI